MTDFLLILAGFAAGCVYATFRHGQMSVDGLRRLLPLGGGGPDPTDPRK